MLEECRRGRTLTRDVPPVSNRRFNRFAVRAGRVWAPPTVTADPWGRGVFFGRSWRFRPGQCDNVPRFEGRRSVLRLSYQKQMWQGWFLVNLTWRSYSKVCLTHEWCTKSFHRRHSCAAPCDLVCVLVVGPRIHLVLGFPQKGFPEKRFERL